jgi:hypothetical protein
VIIFGNAHFRLIEFQTFSEKTRASQAKLTYSYEGPTADVMGYEKSVSLLYQERTAHVNAQTDGCR